MSKAHVRIATHTYRRVPGFLVMMCGHAWRRDRIFTHTRTSAERIKAKMLAGEEVTLKDFEP